MNEPQKDSAAELPEELQQQAQAMPLPRQRRDRPPYGGIATLLHGGDVIPFLGAGVNFGTRTPANAEWNTKSGFLPSGAELSQYLARQSEFPLEDEYNRKDLAKVSSYYVEKLGRDPLRKGLNRIFEQDYQPGSIHTYLAQVAPPLIVTTNYDDLTEKAFQAAGRRFYVVVHLTDREDWANSVMWWKYNPAQDDEPEVYQPGKPVCPSELDHHIDLTDATVIYKMHGTVDRLNNEWHSYVITEDDYVDFLSRMTGKMAVPSMFIQHFNNRHFLFLGYGLGDWNLRVVLRDVLGNTHGNRQRSWAIQFQPSALEEDLWQRRGVDIYDMDINQFVAELLAASKDI